MTADPTLTKRLIESSVPFYNPQARTDADPVVTETVARWVASADTNPDAKARANGDWLLRLCDLVTDVPQSPREASDDTPSDEEIAKRRHLRLDPNRELIEQAEKLGDSELVHFLAVTQLLVEERATTLTSGVAAFEHVDTSLPN